MDKTLVIGYGNVDRQDDGAAWHILARLAGKLAGVETASAAPAVNEASDLHHLAGFFDPDLGLELDTPLADLRFVLQLTPETAEMMAAYPRVCFVDAHTQAVAEPIQAAAVIADHRPSAMTHHMTPANCVGICQALYAGLPETMLVSVRGHEFGFSRHLSHATQALIADAVDVIINWIKTPVACLGETPG